MKTKSRNLLISVLIVFAMLFSVLAITPLTANAAGGTEKVDFSIKEPFDVYFETTGSHNNYPVTLNNENKLSVQLPTLYRTDTLDFVFDGWYIANSDTKITQDYVFDGYTVLVDRWTYSEFDSNYKVSNIEINNPELTIGTKQGEYTADVAIANVDGITQNSGVNFTIYKGLNKSGDALVGDETIEIGKNYSAVTTITLKDGYKFDDQLKFTSDNGLCADWKYRGNFFENNWSTLATQVEVVINFVGDNEYYFSQQPESRTLENYSEYHYWYALQEPDNAESLDSVILQYKQQDESWALFGPATMVVSPYADRTITFRLLADYGDAGYIYSEPWTITWTKVNGTIDNIQLGVTSPKENGTPSYAKANSDPRYYQAYENNATTQNGIKWSGSVSGDLEVGNETFNKNENYTVSIKLVAQEGYSFDIANLTATINANNAQVTGTSEEVTVTYTFEKEAVKNYNVYFGSGVHGTGIMETVSANEGEEYELPACAFTPITNYQFSSWSVSGQLMMPGDTITITEDITVFAIWQGVSTPVAEGFTTQPTGGTTATGAVFTAQFVVNESIQYNSVNVLKYNSETDDWDSFISSSDLTTISNGGKIVGVGFSNSSKASETLRLYAYRDGVCVAKSEIFTVNWVDCEFTEQPQGSKVIVGSTYTFTWKTNFAVTRYRILCFDGENWSAIAETTGNSWSVTSDTEKSLTYQVCADMSYIMSNGNINYRFDIAKSQAFVVTWGEAPTPEYIVSYEANSGSGTMVGDTITAGEQFTLDTCTYIAPENKQFVGWAVGNVEARPLLQAGDSITINEPTIIYAIWENIPVVKYDVAFNANGGSGSMLDETEQLGGYVLPECEFTAPTGKQFKCWAEGSALGEQFAVGYEYDVTSNVTFFAIWEDIPAQHVHDHGTAWESDANNHWNECSCGDKANKNAHNDGNADGKCDVCDYQMTNGGGNIETPDESKDGLSGGAIAGIVVGSVVVVGVGGFAIFWFVIKKKSFADLIAVFNKK